MWKKKLKTARVGIYRDKNLVVINNKLTVKPFIYLDAITLLHWYDFSVGSGKKNINKFVCMWINRALFETLRNYYNRA